MNALLTALGSALSVISSPVSLGVLAVRIWLMVNARSLRTLALRVPAAVLAVGFFALGDGFDRVAWLYECAGVWALIGVLALTTVITLVAMDGVIALLGKLRRN